ncbi:MAG: molybdenum cofactor guanylyltransferase MobA [Gammaproteobacteria bacterium]|nr:molybdenum cofactor guanylyltransferase MobA [Gammaproteobacteria bacterium]
MNQALNDITGVILAGGRASRMNGQDKGLVNLAGKPMIEHVIAAIDPQVSEIVINANRSREAYAGYGRRIIADATGDYAGPLAGIAAGIEAATTDLILTVPCDGPWLPADLVLRLKQGLDQSPSKVCVAHDGGRIQPVFGLFHKDALPEIHNYLNGGDRKLLLWINQQEPAIVDFSDHPAAFINVNTPEEKARVEQILLMDSPTFTSE